MVHAARTDEIGLLFETPVLTLGKPRMKIIFFVENNHAGGMDTFFTHLFTHWPDANDELVLVGNASHVGLDNIERDIEVIRHHIPLNWTLADRFFWFLPLSLRKIIRYFLRVLLLPFQYVALKRLFRATGGDRLLVVNGAYPGGETCRLASIAWGRMGRAKSVHNIRNFAAPPRWLFRWLDNMLDAELLRHTKRFIGVSHVCAESLRCRSSFARIRNITAIHNGVSPDGVKGQAPVQLRSEIGVGPGEGTVLLMLGTYEPRKGHAFLFEALDRACAGRTDVHLVICGHGKPDDIRHVENLKAEYDNRVNIHLLPFYPKGNRLISQADVLLIGSQEWESFGWTAIEAMQQRVPVISTNAGGLREVVGDDGVAALSVNPDDVQGFAERIARLVNSPEERTRIGNNGYDRAARMFTVERMVREYHALIMSDDS